VRKDDARRLGLAAAEIGLLFGALLFTLPPIPSNEVGRLPLLPAGAFAVAMFAASRAIRWRRYFVVAAIETALFAAFVWALNGVANILLNTH
jgi:hypothetical protein